MNRPAGGHLANRIGHNRLNHSHMGLAAAVKGRKAGCVPALHDIQMSEWRDCVLDNFIEGVLGQARIFGGLNERVSVFRCFARAHGQRFQVSVDPGLADGFQEAV
jgi:hypothetical protein